MPKEIWQTEKQKENITILAIVSFVKTIINIAQSYIISHSVVLFQKIL